MPLIAALLAMAAAPAVPQIVPGDGHGPAVPLNVAASPMSPVCQNTRPQSVERLPSKRPPMHDLDREPPANLYSAVLHIEGGCSSPVMVAENFGALGRPGLIEKAPPVE